MLQTLPGRKKYEEKMSNEQPLCKLNAMKNILMIFFGVLNNFLHPWDKVWTVQNGSSFEN